MVSVFQNSLVTQMGSVNGLICVDQYSSPGHYNTYICNPITREIMIIPHSLIEMSPASLTGEYKVVRTIQRIILSNGNKSKLVVEAEVYTLGTGQWRSLGRVPYWLDGSEFGAVLNDHCHWFLFDHKIAPPGWICTFDLNKETFQLFPSPPSEEAIEKSDTHFQSLEYGIKKSWHKEVVVTLDTVSLAVVLKAAVKEEQYYECIQWVFSSSPLLLQRSLDHCIDLQTQIRLLRNTNVGNLQLMEIEDKVDHHHLHYHRLFFLDLNLVPILEKYPMLHVGSVNGLICLWQYTYNLTSTYICNPVTRECMILPRQHFFWDSIAGFVYGFGVSSLTGEYKVVRAFQWKTLPNANKPSQPSLLEVEVYTLGTGQWRSRGPVPVPYLLYPFPTLNGTFLNNHCHWIVCDMENTNKKIAAFDLDKETFQLFPSPPSVKENRCHYQALAILRGCLCNLATCSFQSTIWMMKEYGNKNSWHKEVVITREIVVGELRWLHLIEGLRDGRILMVFKKKTLCI
ncbi:hypothetical protein OSB04_016186 [Centaurea solstitialis]|uniref:F-box associated domain-containing protein n=1 Tax=Centaurea solstitialis TaxID=347529 RepID=A0AA38WKT8_9ASTR|nr:hypothetical protein OSB04_016186 [Centaurea solstitialis]